MLTQLLEPRLSLSTKEKRACVELRPLALYGESMPASADEASAQQPLVTAEIQAMYQLPSGAPPSCARVLSISTCVNTQHGVGGDIWEEVQASSVSTSEAAFVR